MQNKIPPLREIYLYLTYRCNLSCAHCWIPPEGNHEEIDQEILLSEIKKALPLGLKSIKITGGEPFCEPTLIRLIEKMRELGLGVRLETNGTLINKSMAINLRRLNVYSVSVSLDGATPKTHDGFRGREGSFHATLTGIRLLVEQGIPVSLVCALHRGNIGEIEDIIALSQSLGVGILKLTPVLPMGRGEELKEEKQLLSAREILSLFQQYAKHARVFWHIPFAFWPVASLRTLGNQRCLIHHILGILPDSQISICGIGSEIRELIMGKVGEVSIKEIWHSSPLLREMRETIPAKLEGICGKCIFKSFCLGFCRAEAFLRTGRLTAPFWLCEQAYQEGIFPLTRLI
ncbi:MAG: radical SAM protein [Caldiserica bacterium]|nr:radical SAM protein [Caldisericota bacterium]